MIRLDIPREISIRPMIITDLEKVVELDRMSFSMPWPESSFRFEIESNQVSRCWVAEVGLPDSLPRIAGMIVIWLIVDEVHIATLAVHPDFRRMKIAQTLLAATLIDAFHSGASRSFLEVRKSNTAARSLYERFGFKEAGIRRHYYMDNGEHAVLMNLDSIDLERLESLL